MKNDRNGEQVSEWKVRNGVKAMKVAPFCVKQFLIEQGIGGRCGIQVAAPRRNPLRQEGVPAG